MKGVALLAANYLREQRWAVLLLLAFVAFTAALATFGHMNEDDALFFVKQQAIYGVAFSTFLASSAIQNQRRTRRILAVLSKGISRAQYLAGLAAGVLLAAAVYCVFMGMFGSLLFRTIALPIMQLWYLLLLLMVACAVAATTVLAFSTFLPPLVALACSAGALGLGAALATLRVSSSFLPVYTLMNIIAGFDPHRHTPAAWDAVAWGVLQSIVLWVIASGIFARRDIAVAIE